MNNFLTKEIQFVKFPIIFPLVYGLILYLLPQFETQLVFITILILAETHFGATWPFFLNKVNINYIKENKLFLIYTPILIANIFDAVKFINNVNQQKANISKEDWEVLLGSINSFVFDVMGLQKSNLTNNENSKINDVLDILLELRDDARKNKNYELSDKIRDMLKNKGISINDSNKDSSFIID